MEERKLNAKSEPSFRTTGASYLYVPSEKKMVGGQRRDLYCWLRKKTNHFSSYLRDPITTKRYYLQGDKSALESNVF